ncbi:cytochrome c family protein [Azospirillum sp. B4]|uniref:c-type cytochrome n=1 Tax=Azospirillum sp. B4 TaxID=95605 RepID=UPI0011DCC4F9|nr:hypothetical protein [Azospirillum sp. B4]
MSDQGGRFRRPGEIVLDYALPALVLAQDVLTTLMPRMDKMSPLREQLRGWHYLVGGLLFLLAVTRLWRWRRGLPPLPTPALPPRARAWAMGLVLATYACLGLTPILGVFVVWSHGMGLHFGPLPALPAPIGEDRGLWLFTGYFHSAFGTSLLVLKATILVSAVYFLFRHGKGLFTAFPRGFGLYALLSMGCSLFALSTFKSYDRGPVVVAEYLAIAAALWVVGALIHRRRAGREPRAGYQGLVPVAVAAVALIAVGLYGPHALFRVSPFATGHVVQADGGATSRLAPPVVETLPPETDFERQVRAETFKWCVFCHTMNKGGAHGTGPNLYAVFGQRMAAAPNFPYGASLAGRGRNGEVWTDEALAAFLSDPDKFAPGTAMVVSSGNITDPERLKALITILKRETGSAAP